MSDIALIGRRTVLKASTVIAGAFGLSTSASAQPGGGQGGGADVVVNPNSPQHPDTIQEGVDEADPGDTVRVVAGTYEEYVDVDTEDVTVTGSNATIDVSALSGGSQNVVQISADGVAWDGIDVTGGPGNGARGISASGSPDDLLQDVTIKNLESYEHGNDGVTLWRVENGLVKNVEAHHNGDNGIYTNGQNNTVRGSTAHHNSDQGIDVSNDYDVVNGDDQNWGGGSVLNSESYENDNGGIELDDDQGDAEVSKCHTHDNDIASNVDASGLVINGTSSIEVATQNTFEDGIAVNGIDTDP